MLAAPHLKSAACAAVADRMQRRRGRGGAKARVGALAAAALGRRAAIAALGSPAFARPGIGRGVERLGNALVALRRQNIC